MNERILELAVEARKYAESKPDIYQVAYDKKFAELIVRECCDVLQNEDIRYSGYGYNQGFLHKKIKQHFGVEE